MSNPPSRSRSSYGLHSVLSDPNLTTSSSSALLLDANNRQKFEHAVKRYYYQLTVGCNHPTCSTRLCKSYKNAQRCLPDAAAVLAVQLASRPHSLFCPYCPLDPDIYLPVLSAASSGASTPRHAASPPPNPFLHSMLASSTFSSLFTAAPSYPSPPAPDPRVKHDASPPPHINKLSRSSSSTLLFDLSSTLYDMTSRLTRSISYQLLGHSILNGNPLDSSLPQTKSFIDLHQQDLVSPSSPLACPPDIYCSSSSTSIFPGLDGVLKSLSYSLWTETVLKLKADVDQDSVFGHWDGGLDDNAHAFLQASIRHVFSNPDVLAHSFRLSSEGSSTLELKSSSSSTCGLDLQSIPLTYQAMLSLVPVDQYRLSLADALELLIARLNIDIHGSFDNPIKLTIIPIILANPLLNDPAYAESLVRPILSIISRLKPKAKTILVQWLAQYPTDMFKDLMEMVKSYLSAHYYPNPKPTDGIVVAIRVLGMLYCANELKPCKDLVPYQSFYIERLNTELNFKEEYRTWRKLLDKLGSRKSPDVHFSYLSYPFLFDPTSKSRILHIDAMVQMAQEYEDACVSQALVVHTQKMLLADASRSLELENRLRHITNPYLVLDVGRHTLVHDVMLQVCNKTHAELKRPLKVKFKNEQGLDAGGVQKELFLQLVDQLLDPKFGMFSYDEETRYSWINPSSLESTRQYELVGIVLGLALYNGVIVGVRFPRLFYKRLLGEQPTIQDVRDTWPDLGKGLAQLLNWDEAEEGASVEDVFCRSFDVSVQGIGVVSTVELVPGGSNIPVTVHNRQQYVDLYVEWCTKKSVNTQFHALRRGFHQVCGGYAVNMCRAEELELLMCGQEIEMDLHDLEPVCVYDDGYHAQHPVIRMFWDIVHMHFNSDQRRKLIEFVTASDRVPLKGISSLTFVIQRNGPDSDRLPTALTCFSRLLLPEYTSEEKLRRFLLTAVENAKGFGLI